MFIVLCVLIDNMMWEKIRFFYVKVFIKYHHYQIIKLVIIIITNYIQFTTLVRWNTTFPSALYLITQTRSIIKSIITLL